MKKNTRSRSSARPTQRWNPVDTRSLKRAIKMSAQFFRRAFPKVPFAAAGGVAVQTHGYLRETTDMDWIVPSNLEPALTAALAGPDGQRMLIGGMRTIRFGPAVDFIAKKGEQRVLYDAALSDALQRPKRLLAGVQVPVISLEWLVVLKMASGRFKDKGDVAELLWRTPVDRSGLRWILERYEEHVLGLANWRSDLEAYEADARQRAAEGQWKQR